MDITETVLGEFKEIQEASQQLNKALWKMKNIILSLTSVHKVGNSPTRILLSMLEDFPNNGYKMNEMLICLEKMIIILKDSELITSKKWETMSEMDMAKYLLKNYTQEEVFPMKKKKSLKRAILSVSILVWFTKKCIPIWR